MSYIDDLNYQRWLLLKAAKSDEPTVGAAAYEAAWGSGVDPIHIAQYLAAMVAPLIPDDKLEEELTVAAAAVAAKFPESGPPIYETPRGKVRRTKP